MSEHAQPSSKQVVQQAVKMRSADRAGNPCQSPAVSGKRRCRMRGGANGSGPSVGNRNALKHGRYTAKLLELRRRLAKLDNVVIHAAGHRSELDLWKSLP